MSIAEPKAPPIEYPSGDGQPMAETWLHVQAIMLLHQALEDFFRARPDVFIASDNWGQTVALKVLKESAESDPLAIMLIRREARAGLAVSHPHLVRLLDSYVARSPYFIVMEFVAGESAKRRLLNHGPLPVAVVLGIARQIAEGLAALHRAGLIHGDVKPTNVILPSPGKAKLVDLGFTHHPGELKPWVDKKHVIGTANYIAPEMAMLPPDDTPAADLFSLGVMLYEVLTGKLPYPGRSTVEVVRNRRKCKPAVLPAGNWPFGVSELITRLTDPNNTHRPTSRQLVSEITALQIAALGRRAA